MRAIALPFALLAVAAAGAAEAHARLVKADPKVGSTVAASPARLWLRFNEVPRLPGTGVQVTGPGGAEVKLGPLAKDTADVRAIVAPVPERLAPGRYNVRWKALSPDAHHTEGDFSFIVAP
jgi:methionine-rich copper-binding protein CopC